MINRSTSELVYVVGSVKMRDVTDVCCGKQTDTFMDTNNDLSPPELCFSVLTARRTVDLQVCDIFQIYCELWGKIVKILMIFSY